MDPVQFEQVIRQQMDRSMGVLLRKQEEYATDEDRLHNFHQAASLQECTEMQACGGFLAKHLVSIYDLIKKGKVYGKIDIWNEKITDAMNYLFLLRAIVEEQNTADYDEIVMYADGMEVSRTRFSCKECHYQDPDTDATCPDGCSPTNGRPRFVRTSKRRSCHGCADYDEMWSGACSRHCASSDECQKNGYRDYKTPV